MFDTAEVRISLQKLLALLVIVIVPVSLIGLYVNVEGLRLLEEQSGAHLKSVAQTAAENTANFLDDRIREVRSIAVEPEVLKTVAAANADYRNASQAAIRQRITQIEEGWDRPAAMPVTERILTSPAAQLLRRLQQHDPRLLRVTVTDRVGATVAATDRPVRYFQGDQEYWKTLSSGDGRGEDVSHVMYQKESRSDYIRVAVPVTEPGSGRFVGAVDAWVDVSGLFARFSRPLLEQTMRMQLVSDDGTVIAAPEVRPSMQFPSEEYRSIRDALGTPQGRQTGYLVASMKGGERLVGFADTGLKDAYPQLAWIVLASQDREVALAPIRTPVMFAFFLVLLSLAMLALLGSYVYLHRRQQVMDIAGAEAEAEEEGPRDRASAA